MENNAITQLEKEILFLLKEEYTFYQTLYLKLDQQKDYIKYHHEDKLIELFAEIERLNQRIRKSEAKIKALKDRNPKIFRLATVAPEVRKIINSIVTMVKKSVILVADNETYIKNRYERIQDELDELKHSEQIMKYIQPEDLSSGIEANKK